MTHLTLCSPTIVLSAFKLKIQDARHTQPSYEAVLQHDIQDGSMVFTVPALDLQGTKVITLQMMTEPVTCQPHTTAIQL